MSLRNFAVGMLVVCGCALALIGEEAKPGRKFAFLVGVGDYKHESRENQLGAPPVNDVREMKKVLEAAGFQVVMLTDDDDATQAKVVAAFELLLEGKLKASDAKNALGNRDLLLVQLCGHGIQVDATDPEDPEKKKKLQPFLKVYDSKPTDTDTMVPFNAFVRKASENRVRTLFLVDACRVNADPNLRGRSGITSRNVNLPDCISILFSCAQGQEAQQDDKVLKHGVFTFAVLKTLRGQTGKSGKLRWGDLTTDVMKQFEEDEEILAVLNGSKKRQTPITAEGQNESTAILSLASIAKAPMPSVPVPVEVDLAERKGGDEVSFEIADGVKMVFCWIPKGKATLGSPASEKDRSDDEKEHEFATEGFWLAKTECTQSQWESVMGENPSSFCVSGRSKETVQGIDTGNFPVEQVSWDDTQLFLKKLNARGGVAKTFGRAGAFKLPHEDQWEYACRGGKGNKQAFYWGGSLNGDKANCNGERPYGIEVQGEKLKRTSAVGIYAKLASHPWGLSDMTGNVWEWCDNLYSSEQKVASFVVALGSTILRDVAWRSDSTTRRRAALSISVSASPWTSFERRWECVRFLPSRFPARGRVMRNDSR